MSEVRTKLDSLLGTSGTGKGVKEKSPLPGIPPSVGIGMPKVSGGAGTSAGEEKIIISTDGLFTFHVGSI